MPVETIQWHKGRIKLVDQTLLPNKFKHIYCDTVKSIWEAIKNLRVRGAPAIGIAGALGVVLGMQNSKAKGYAQFKKRLEQVISYLSSSRPTAVNLFWALDRMRVCCEQHRNLSVNTIKSKLLNEAKKIIDEDKNICRNIGRNGAKLIKDGDVVLTHCNAGGLATADYGTALGVIFFANEQGKKIRVYADETRPLLQGARLTTWELMRAGIDVTLICDNMAGSLMRQGKISCVIVGADRIASNGDTANKIGTYSLAVLAKAHNIPFYVAAPISTFDMKIKSGKQIPIEQRSPEEITNLYGKRIAPKNINVYNPAFDVTPARLISAIITECGIIKKPDKKKIIERKVKS
ncbi:MAG: S-methyl-5-thioribose-1-phosphate isomerase [bacterium]|nr:S-methyl-5-thioribose-1-phosphate isomerase [bacterium]